MSQRIDFLRPDETPIIEHGRELRRLATELSAAFSAERARLDLVERLARSEARTAELEMRDLAHVKRIGELLKAKDVTQLASCMGLPTESGESMSAISAAVQQHTPWSGKPGHCVSVAELDKALAGDIRPCADGSFDDASHARLFEVSKIVLQLREAKDTLETIVEHLRETGTVDARIPQDALRFLRGV